MMFTLREYPATSSPLDWTLHPLAWLRGRARRARSMGLALLGILLLTGALTPSLAQRLGGTLQVQATDQSGGVVPDAKVTATHQTTNITTEATSSGTGTYVFPNLVPGAYSVTVEKTGFRRFVRQNVMVRANQVVDATAQLEVGEVTTIVEVVGESAIRITTADVSSSYSSTLIGQLPVATAGGDVKELAVTFPNTTTQPGGVAGDGGSIAGLRPRFNSFTIDGADDNSVSVNGSLTPVIGEAVEEFTLLVNPFSVEYGHSAGGIFTTTTKSGTNNLHGEAHFYNRNRNYNAFDNLEASRGAKDRYDYNRLGGSVGGPILRDKLFFFGAYQHEGEGKASSGPTVNTPTAAGLTTLKTLARNSAVVAILDQFAVAPAATGTTIVNGIPIPIGEFQGLAPSFVDQHDFNINADLHLGRHQMRGRFLYDRFRAPNVNPVQPQPQFNGSETFDARKVIFNDVWTISPTVVNEFLAAYSRSAGGYFTVPQAFANFPNVNITDLGINLGPEGNSPQGQTINTYQWSDNITKVYGNHTFKGGVQVRKYIFPSDFLPRARGEWDYATLQTLINDLVPDGANGALRGAGSGGFAANFNSFYGFFQDTWKVLPRLTLNLGIRYEYNGVPRDTGTQAGNAIADAPAVGLFFRVPKPDTNNWAPRFGFAYDPTGSGRWSVRGGIGFFYDITPTNFPTLQLPPQLQSEQNPAVTCALGGAPAWCPAAATVGFLAGGGLLQVNVPPTNQADARAATQGLILDYVEPKILSWSLGVQHEIVTNTTVEVRYVGNHAVSMARQQRLGFGSASAFDSRFPGGGITPLPTFFTAASVPAAIPSPASTLADFLNFNTNPLEPEGFFGTFTIFPQDTQSIHHSASVEVIRRLTRGLYIQGSFTFAKTIDNATNELFTSRVNPRRGQDGNNIADERGRSVLDINKKFSIAFVYSIPNLNVDNATARGFLHGWQLSGTYLAQSGQPVTALSGVDSNANGDSAGDRVILNPNGVGLTGSTANFVCNDGAAGATRIVTSSASCASNANIVGYLAQNSTARYIQARVGARATLGRNTIDTPGLNIWNISIMKETTLTERFKLQLRMDTFNPFNHRNFSIGLPTNSGAIDQGDNPNPLSTAYPFVTAGSLFLNNSAFNGGNRELQIGLKLIF